MTEEGDDREQDERPSNVASAVAPPPPESDRPAPISREAVRAYLSRREVLRGIERHARTRFSHPQRAEDLAQDTVEAALRAKSLPQSEAALPGWVGGILDNLASSGHRKAKRRGRYEGEIEEPENVAEERPSEPPPEIRLTPWLEKETANNPRDAELLRMLRRKANEALTDAELAEKEGLTMAALEKRKERFVQKYTKRRRAYLARIGMLIVLLLLAVLAIAKWLWWPRTPESTPVPPPASAAPERLSPPAPSASSVAPFEPAGPPRGESTEGRKR